MFNSYNVRRFINGTVPTISRDLDPGREGGLRAVYLHCCLLFSHNCKIKAIKINFIKVN